MNDKLKETSFQTKSTVPERKSIRVSLKMVVKIARHHMRVNRDLDKRIARRTPPLVQEMPRRMIF